MKNKKLTSNEKRKIATLAIEFFSLEHTANKSRSVLNNVKQSDFNNTNYAQEQEEFLRLVNLRISSIRKEIRTILALK